MKYLDFIPPMGLHDYNGRLVSPDGREVFTVCGHDIAPPIVWVTPYIDGAPPHSKRSPCRLAPTALRLPLHFREGMDHALHILWRTFHPGEVPGLGCSLHEMWAVNADGAGPVDRIIVAKVLAEMQQP